MNSIEHLQNLPVFLPLPSFPPLQIHSSIFPCHCHQAALQFSASNATNPIIPFFYSFEYQTQLPHPLSSIILLNSLKPLNQPSLTRRQNKILQPLSEFLRPLPCRINIRNSDSPIAVAQTLIIFPGTQIALYRINNITRKNIWRTNNLHNLIANFRHQKISLLKPNQPLHIRSRIRTPLFPRRKMLRPVSSVDMLYRTVNPPEAQRLFNSIVIRKPLLASPLHREHKPDLLRRPVIFQKPATPNRPRRSIKKLSLKSFFFHIIIIHLSRIFKSRIHRAAFRSTPHRSVPQKPGYPHFAVLRGSFLRFAPELPTQVLLSLPQTRVP